MGWLQPPTQYASDGVTSLAYFDADGGPETIVFVPGTGCHLEMMPLVFPDTGRFYERLNRYSRLIVFDKRGAGMSDPIVGAPSLEDRITDIELIMGAAGVERATLFGGSEGAAISLLFAATHPHRVERLILAGGYAKFLQSDDYPYGASEDEWHYLAGEYCDAWGTGVSAARYWTDSQANRSIAAPLERAICTPTTMRRLVMLLRDLDVRPALEFVTCPTLVVAERDDRGGGPPSYLAESISGAELCLLEGDHHLPIFGTPSFDQWGDAIERFVTGVAVGHIDEDRRLASIVFSDIVDSTAMVAAIGDREWRERLDRFDELVGSIALGIGGRVVKSTGDGALAVFDAPARALRYANAVRDEVRQRLDLHTRSGVHVGEVVFRGDDVSGISVHIAARLEGLAGTDEVLSTAVVEQLCLGSGIDFVDAGTSELKGVPGQWSLRRVA